MQVGGAIVYLSFMAEQVWGRTEGGLDSDCSPGLRGLFIFFPLKRFTALLLLHFRKESIEKIKNMASGEFKIRFLQNAKWKREGKKNRNREPHDLHKSYICCLGGEQCGSR
jgi:hypothetical protein